MTRPFSSSAYAHHWPMADCDAEAAQMVANMNQLLQKEIDRLSTENAQIEEQLAVAQEFAAAQELAAAMQEMNVVAEEEVSVEELDFEVVDAEEIADEEPVTEETAVSEMEELLADAEIAALLEEEGIIKGANAEMPEEEPVEAEFHEEDFLAEMATEFAAAAQETVAEQAEEKETVEVPEAPVLTFATKELPKIELPADIDLDVSITKLSKEQKELFTYFYRFPRVKI